MRRFNRNCGRYIHEISMTGKEKHNEMGKRMRKLEISQDGQRFINKPSEIKTRETISGEFSKNQHWLFS